MKNDLSERLTTFVGSDQIPSWYENKIYFASDRSLTLNMYSYDLDTKDIIQLTNHKEFDVMWPSGSNGQIAYENGGYIYKLDLATNKETKLAVNITFDNPNIIPYYKKVDGDINGAAISPSGKRVLFDARGDIFSVPAEEGITVNLTNTQGVREIQPAWSPNGKYIVYASDATGEYELYLLENAEGAKAKQITFNSMSWKFDTEWSPDSKYLLFTDRTHKLQLLNVESGEIKVVDKADQTEIRTYNFSADSKWITYEKNAANGQNAIWVYSLNDQSNHKLTGDTFGDYSPVFSKDGNYIFFLSDRTFNLSFSSFEMDYLYNDATRIYAIALKNSSQNYLRIKMILKL